MKFINGLDQKLEELINDEEIFHIDYWRDSIPVFIDAELNGTKYRLRREILNDRESMYVWYLEAESVLFKEVFENVPDQIKKKLIYHLELLDF